MAGRVDDMDYAAIKLIHQTAVTLSVSGFFIRGAASLLGAAWVRGRMARTVPHLVDSLLLLSGLTLAWTLRLTPDRAPWLLAKLAGLVVYVGLGVIALRPGRPRGVRAAAWVGALAVVGWMVSVAILKHPLGIFSLAARP